MAISRQRHRRSFLMLELLIALFLVGMCALPLARIPMSSLSEQLKSMYRLHIPRLADLAFAEAIEKIHSHKISWKELSKSKQTIIMKDDVTVDLGRMGKKTFHRQGTISSVGKKGKNQEELRLVTFKVHFQESNKSSSSFVYKVLLKKIITSNPMQDPVPDQNKK